MAVSGIHGQKLEITVVGCNQLKDTWYGRHKPYVSLMYGTSSHRTKTSGDGGKNPSFNEKFEFCLIDGVHELIIQVCSSHHILDSFIGGGTVNLDKVFREGYNVTLVPLESLTGRQAGEVKLILQYYPNSNVHQQQGSPYPPQNGAQAQSSFGPQISPYPPQCMAQAPSAPQGSPYPPQYGVQAPSEPQGSPYPPQHWAQGSSAPQGSPYPPQYGAQAPSAQQGSPYPPQYGVQAPSAPQGSPSYPPRYQEAPAPQRPQAPRYTKQDIHDAKIRMMDAQIQRSMESMDRMNAIGTTSGPVRWTTVQYTNRYEDSMDAMNRL